MLDSAQIEENLAPSWPRRTQAYAVAALAVIAAIATLIFLFLPNGSAPKAAPAARMTTFVPTSEQRARLQIQTVGHRIFHTDIATEGYVAPNGGFALAGAHVGIAHGLPILTGQSSDMLQAEADLATASAQFRAADSNEKRQHALFEAEGAAEKDWQQAQVDVATAGAALASARSRLRILGKSDTDFASVTQKPSVFSVGDLSTVWLVANVREADAALVHLGNEADVSIAAYPDETFHAAIAYIASVIDPNTHRLVIGAQIRNAGGRLKPNMAASFVIHGGRAMDAPAVPQNALVHEGDAARVWLAGPHGDLYSRRVTIGRSSGGFAEVTSGLNVGDKIVTSDSLFIDQAVNGN